MDSRRSKRTEKLETNLKSKADKRLGLDNPASEGAVLVQKAGYIFRLEGLILGGFKTWKKLYCVVKDGFILWYNEEPHSGGFPLDVKPKGVLPLGGCTISKDFSESCVLVLSHPEIPYANFRLRSENENDCMEWLIAIEDGKKATWEKALLGNALVEKLKAEGTARAEEKEAAFHELQGIAQKLEQEREQASKVVAKDQTRQEAFKAKLKVEQEKNQELETKRVELAKHLDEETEATRRQAAKRQSMERKLASAELALQKLEKAVNESSMGKNATDEGDVKASVSALRAFFEAKAQEQERRRKAMGL